MQKSTVAIILIVLILLGGAGAAWFIMSGTVNGPGQRPHTQDMAENQAPAAHTDTSTDTATDFTDLTAKTEVDVAMADLAYKPANIKIKKGTTVTWTNNDTVPHNVVATDPSNTGGLPTASPTFGQGGTYKMTFQQVGTFEYLCTPHKTFMRGTIRVVE